MASEMGKNSLNIFIIQVHFSFFLRRATAKDILRHGHSLCVSKADCLSISGEHEQNVALKLISNLICSDDDELHNDLPVWRTQAVIEQSLNPVVKWDKHVAAEHCSVNRKCH